MTAQKSLDKLFKLAKDNNYDSIELLQNIALGEGEIADYAQHKLCQILFRCDGGSYKAASSVRSLCQNLIIDYSNTLINYDFLADHPKILLIASAKIEGEEMKPDAIPQTIRSRVVRFDSQKEKPQWWSDNSPKNGVFYISGSDLITSNIFLVRKYSLPDDGACQFRAAFILRDKNANWLNASKEDILIEVSKNKNLIIDGINESVSYLKNIIPVPAWFEDFFAKSDFANIIYKATIESGDFTLYSPHGIALAIEEVMELSDEEHAFLTLLADNIGDSLNKQFNLALSANTGSAYAEHIHGNHYNIVAPIDFFQ